MQDVSSFSELILASASPRRKALLSQIGIPYQVIASHIDETPFSHEMPHRYVERMAEYKAEQVSKQFHIKDNFILSADTVVVIGKEILGKPKSEHEAIAMLQKLQGKNHSVLTCIFLLQLHKGIKETRTVKTQVTMKPLGNLQIQHYVQLGESLDKAGAYAIQGYAAAFITQVVGCYFNVMGLPLSETVDLLLQHRAIDTWPLCK